MKRISCAAVAGLVTGSLLLFAGPAARADIPAGYKGKPFDPAVAGGPKCPASVKAGPYAIPGRLDFVNYDLGGDGVAYHTGDHIVKGGTGYRVDTPPTATFSLTSACAPICPNVWYDSGTAIDGTVYPSATTADFSIGAVQNGDWVNITVNVTTTGTYSLSSTWATGNGPPGGEGGDGTMGLAVFSNGTQLTTWSAVFPNYNTTADFRHWKPYANFATVTLAAGMQVIKLQSKAKHLQLDYVQFDLVGGDGGTPVPDAGAPTDGGATGAGGSGAGGTTGAAGTGAAGGTSGSAGVGAAGDASGTGNAGSSGAAGTGTTGAAGTIGGGTTGAAGTGVKGATGNGGGCSCALAASGGAGAAGSFLTAAAMALGLIARAQRRRRAPAKAAAGARR
jgi:hypothetical protein